MMIFETIHVTGKPVGRLLVDTNSHEFVFQPRVSPSLLPDREWISVDELRAAVTAANLNPINDEGTSLGAFRRLQQQKIGGGIR